jgi:hypothetical protein
MLSMSLAQVTLRAFIAMSTVIAATTTSVTYQCL